MEDDDNDGPSVVNNGRRVYLFRKTHTFKEVAQYVVDPDAPDLTMSVSPLFDFMKWAYVALNIGVTFASCGALIWLSFPYYVEDYGNGNLENLNFLTVVELLCVIFFTFDYIIRLIFTDKTWKVFVRDVVNIIDVLTTVPYYLSLILSASGAGTEVFRVFFILRMLRIIRLSKYNPGMELVMSTIHDSLGMLSLFVVIVLISMVITSTAYFFAERGEWDPASRQWMQPCHDTVVTFIGTTEVLTGDTCTRRVAPYQSILESMYWSVVMLTTTGYRIESPVTSIGRTIALCTSILGVFYFAAPATVLATNYKLARRRVEEEINSRRFDQRATVAMKAQEELRKELERVWKLNDNSGKIKFRVERTLVRVSEFEFDGELRSIFEVRPGHYVYVPLILLKRDKYGDVMYTDDFNLHTAQRVVTCYLITDSDAARVAARDALIEDGFIDPDADSCETLVSADPMTSIQVYHDFQHSYPGLNAVVHFDHVTDLQAANSEDELPLRFVIDMPHVHAVSEVIPLLERTRLHVSVGLRRNISTMHIPLLVDNLMATQLVRELFAIAYERKDGESVAYIHPNDAAQLLEGFCDQFIPTPSSDVLIMSPELADQEVIAAVRSSFPVVKLDWIPPEGANSVYRSGHINIDSIHDSYLLEVNLTQLSNLDNLGYGHRFKIHVPVCQEDRRDINFQLI